MSEKLVQQESHSHPSILSRFFKMFSFIFPVLNVIKFIIASVTSVIFLAFACVTLGGSAVALIVSSPLFIIFSPVLVPATIATTLLASGFAAGTTLGLTGIGLIMALFRPAGEVTLAQSMLGKIIINRIKSRMGGGGMGGGGLGGGGLGRLKKIIEIIKKFRGMSAGGAAADPATAPAADPAAAPAAAPAAPT